MFQSRVSRDLFRCRGPEEPVAGAFGGVAVGFGAGLGVDAERHPRVGVAEPGLGGLEVDAFEDESGGVGAAEVVELGPFDAGLLSRRVPGLVQPVRLVEVFALRTGKHEGVGISRGESPSLEMLDDEICGDNGDGQGPPSGLGLGWAEGRAASGASGDLFGDRNGRSVEVDSTNPETGAFAPPQPEHGPEMHHQPVVGLERLSEVRQLASGEHGPVGWLDGRQPDPSTR